MRISKTGIVLSSLYVAITFGLWVYSWLCEGIFCGLVVVFPVLPWVIIIENIIRESFVLYFVFVTLNAGIIYGIGMLSEKMVKRAMGR